MNILNSNYVKDSYDANKHHSISGRWITSSMINDYLHSFQNTFSIQQLGVSEEQRPIHKLIIGKGKKRIFIWTQMHGNESTGTKAVCDLLNYLKNTNDKFAKAILSNCIIHIIPVLNPDGAEAYTRVNSKGIDLNRDAVDLSAIESQVLRNELDSIQPDFCFNLHDQRTIFGVQGTQNPATLSFLAPSEEESRKVTEGRIKTMNIIVAMNRLMQQMIPNHIGRYTDEFYPTATGDNFQKLGYPTVLIESGHYPEDYERENVRKYTFMALLQGIYHIASTNIFKEYDEYFEIPNNEKSFYDLIHRYSNKEDEVYQFEEILKDKKIIFEPKLVPNIDSTSYFYHKENVFVT